MYTVSFYLYKVQKQPRHLERKGSQDVVCLSLGKVGTEIRHFRWLAKSVSRAGGCLHRCVHLVEIHFGFAHFLVCILYFD